MKIRLLADYWVQRKKDAEGVVYTVTHTKGDEVDVNDAEARQLLREGKWIKPMAEKVSGDTPVAAETEKSDGGSTKTVTTVSAKK